MNSVFVSFALVAFLLSSQVAAEDKLPGLATNGCGSGKTAFLVPNRIGNCKLKEACDRHDICYGRCLEGGDLFNTSACKSSDQEKELRRQKCDSSLFEDIVQNNQGECRSWASFYKFFVVNAGGGFFNGITMPDLDKIISTSKTPDEALSKLEYLKVLDKTDVLDFKRMQIEEGVISIPTVRAVPGLKEYTNGKINVPNDFQATSKNLRALRLQVEKR
jgi:hypothetical protein